MVMLSDLLKRSIELRRNVLPVSILEPGGHYMYRTVVTICTAQWSLYVPPGLTFTNSTFCPHSVFICFVWISEQTAIISLYSIN